MYGRIVLSLAVGLVLVSSLHAADAAKPKKKKGDNIPAQAFSVPKTIELSAEQQTKLDELKKELGPGLAELMAKKNSILTDEQKQAQQAASKAAKDAGKKGKEAKAAVDAAVTLSDDQQKQLAAANEEIKAYQGKIRERINSFLSDDQKAKLKSPKKAKPAK